MTEQPQPILLPTDEPNPIDIPLESRPTTSEDQTEAPLSSPEKPRGVLTSLLASAITEETKASDENDEKLSRQDSQSRQTLYPQSQNIFAREKVARTFLGRTFLLYSFVFLPAFALVVAKKKSDFDLPYNLSIFVWIFLFLSLAFSLPLAFSRRVARVFPLNYLLYSFCVLCFSDLATSIQTLYKTNDILLVSTGSLLTFGVSQLICVLSLQSPYSKLKGFVFSLSFSPLPLLAFVFLFGVSLIIAGLVIVIVQIVGFLVIHCAKEMVINRSFSMIPQDIIMAAMKLFLVIPAIPELDFRAAN